MNSTRGAVPFEVEGESYVLRLTTNAQVRYQDAAGESLLRAVAALQKEPDDLRRLRRIVWAGLSHIPGMTEEKAGDLMDALGLHEAARLIGEAFRLAFPEAQAGGNGSAGKPKKATP